MIQQTRTGPVLMFLLSLVLFVLGCLETTALTDSSDGSADDRIALADAVVLTPSSLQLLPGQPQQFEAQAVDQSGNVISASFAWSATGGTINQQGLYTAGDVPGQFGVAVSESRTGIADSAAVIVVSPAGATRIVGISFDAASHRRYAANTDLWPITWADDDQLYSAGGDGDGFQGPDVRGMTIARIEGPPTALQGTDLFEKVGVLPTGILSVDGALYIIEQKRGDGFDAVRIGKSTDHGRSWQYNGDGVTDWDYDDNGAFSHASFVQFGRDYFGARDTFVYVIAWDSQTYPGNLTDGVALYRAPTSAIQDRSKHEYFGGLNPGGDPVWIRDLGRRAHILSRPGQVHWGVRMTYNLVLARYVLTVFVDENGTLALYEGPEPWGPWSKFYEGTLAGGGHRFGLGFVNKPDWLSADGLTWWSVFSGVGADDAFNVIKGTLEIERN